jgi:hypothetical protein
MMIAPVIKMRHQIRGRRPEALLRVDEGLSSEQVARACPETRRPFSQSSVHT